MIITTRQCVMCKNHVAKLKVVVTVCTYSLCLGFSETCLCPPHNFVVMHASGVVSYRDLVFHWIVPPSVNIYDHPSINPTVQVCNYETL